MENIRELFQIMARRFGLLNKNCCSAGGFTLSLAHSHILYEIDRQSRPSMQQIADALSVDITTFSRQVQALERMKLVRKTPSPEDRRVYLLSLTTEGKYVAAAIDSQINQYLEEVFSHMNESERETVIRSIRLLNDCMAKSSMCCKPME